MERQSNSEGKMEKATGRGANFVDGVPLGTSHSGGHGSSTSYPGNGKRPFSENKGSERREEFWPLGKSHYTKHHSG